MPGLSMPSQSKPAKAKPKRATAARPVTAATAKPTSSVPAAADAMTGMTTPAATDDHVGHDMSAMPGMTKPATAAADPHAGHDMTAMSADPAGDAKGTALPAGDGSAPAPPTDHYADRIYAAATMAAARAQLHREHGGGRFSQLMFNLAEVQIRDGRDGYRWDGEYWYGGDINRLTLKTEGEGSSGERVESSEVQALYSRAIDPYWNLQAGIRQDFTPKPSRTYATVGFEGLAPYWFEVEGALFLSEKGDLLGRLEAYYDQRVTQRLILQPRVEFNLAAQNVRATGTGSGLSTAELGLRLRYEVAREFAPYVGVSWDRKVGDTARFARAAGEGMSNSSLVLGVRFWF